MYVTWSLTHTTESTEHQIYTQSLVSDVSALIGQNLMSKSKCKSLSQRANEYPMSNSILMHVLTADSAKQIIKVELDFGYFQW